MEACGGNVPGRCADCTCESKVAAVGVLSLRSSVKTVPLMSLDRIREFRFDPAAELIPSESSSSSSSERSSLLLIDSDCSLLARRAALTDD